jgi:hypothetical protein
MTRNQRITHAWLWRVLAPIAVAGVIVSLMAR